jgi:hypothetical protein
VTDDIGKRKQSASPYSTGGGGFTFEHRLGALLLTRMLTGGPVTAMDDRTPQGVAFQQSPAALADDLVVTTPAADGVTTVRLDIAVRRTPQFIKSHKTTRELVATLVRADLAAERKTDPALEHRLAVAVSGRQTHGQELADLARVARGQSNADDFEALIRTPGKYKLGSRLDHLTAMVAAALDVIGDDTAGTKEHRSWRLLQRLRIWQVDLEEGHEDEWTRLVADLTPVAIDGTQEQAAALRDRLARLSAQLAQTAGKLDGPALRRQLHGHLAAEHAAPPGWTRLTALDEQARATVARTLASGDSNELLLPRTSARDALRAALGTGGELLVVGDSGVGKSALVMDATTPDKLGEDAQALAVNLRHLPRTPAELLTLFDDPLEVLLGEMTAPERTLVIDAAEAATEDHADVLKTLARGARKVGVRVVAVTTSEAAGAVKGFLKSSGQAPVEHMVDGLDDAELAVVAEHFPSLQRLASDARGRELLRRPIVVDLLGSAGDPGLPLSESQALEHIWSHLVRNQERRQDGMPDARQDVMVRLAEHAVRGGDVSELLARLDHEAVEGLRRSGLLQPPSPLPWERIPAFRHDLLRAYSIARLLLAEADPAAALSRLGTPRWTLPSARLACEILLSAPDEPSLPRAGRFERLQVGFDALAADGKGQRWSDVPSEALLVTPDPKTILEDGWPLLRGDEAAGVARLIRLLDVRHHRRGLVDPVVAAPVIAQLLEEGTPKDVGKEAAELITDWLQALVTTGAQAGDALRVRLRDSLVEQCRESQRVLADQDAARTAELAARTPEQVAADEEESKRFNVFGTSTRSRRRRRKPVPHRPYEWIADEQIEHLSLLGPDLGPGGEAILRQIAEDDPYKLERAVETLFAGDSLASYSAELLADLTLAYYIDEREDDDGGFGWYGGLGDDGIRDHRFYGGPLNHLSMGPFLALFRRDYLRGVSVLNRMLDHAARCRVQILSGFDSHGDEPGEPRIVLSICGESREFTGDGHVWLWYRGTGVGPYPCMSALQALEFVTEEHIRAGVPPQALTTIMLKAANSLAMPALALGVLVRHLEGAGDALDPFLVEPAIWQLEFGRTTHEHSGLAAVIPDVGNPERRTWTLREVSMMLAINSDGDRTDEVKRLGEQLKATARAQVGDDTSPAAVQHLAAVRQWASCLDRDQYQLTQRDNNLLIELTVDPDVEEVLGERNAELRRVNDAIGLTNRHARVRDNGGRAPDVDATFLANDLALARSLLDDPPEPRALSVDGPVAAAASAVELHLSARSVVSDEDLLWSAEVLLKVAAEVAAGPVDEFDDSLFSQGADRSAARALPFLLLPAAAPLREAIGVSDADDIGDVVKLTRAVAVTGSNEARLAHARGLDAVWSERCDPTHLFGTCHHAIAFGLVTDSFLRSRLGDWDVEAQRRSVVELDPPGAEGLAPVEAEKILVRRLTPALRATGAAAASSACCAKAAYESLRSLLDAHRRGMLAHDGYHHSHSDALVAARAALWQAAAGRDELLLEHVSGLLTSSKMLAEALRAVCVAAEEQPDAGRAAQRLWPTIMDLVLDAAEDSGVFTERTWGDWTDAALIPTPAVEWGYLTIELAGEPYRWRDLLSWTPQVERWLTSTRASRTVLVHLVIAVRELDVADQVDHGLRWIEQAVERAGNSCASTDALPEWLRERRADVRGEEQTARWQRVVDLLAVAGDTRVSDLAD